VSRKRLFIILLCILAQRFHDSWTGTMLIAAFVAMFFLMVKKKLEFIKMRPFIFLGTISYTLYLLHENIGFVIIRASYKYNLNPNCGILLATITSLVLATLVTFAVEKPAQRLIRGKYRKLSNLGTDSPSASRQASGAM
jgi:peptidoglycan/LPS O-acetylase OafA/YrhL